MTYRYWDRGLNTLFLVLCGVAVGCWLWHCWCVFPWLLWNELRLAPSFLLTHGLPVYPAPGQGAVTTWIYGPITPLLFLPATLAENSAAALQIAGAINMLIVSGAVLIVCWFWPSGEGLRLGWPARLAAALLALAIWPSSSFQYIQADNAAVALGLFANLLLIRGLPESDLNRWLVAGLTVAAVGCKQTAFGVLIAQLMWLAWGEGWIAAVRQTLRAGVCGVALALACVSFFDPRGLWFNLVEVPAHIPWTSEGFIRIRDLTLLLSVHIGGPLLVLVGLRRKIWHARSPWLLPALSWAAALPPGLASLFKLGGTLNSIESFLLFLPPALVLLAASFRNVRTLQFAFAIAACALVFIRLQRLPNPAWRPRVEQLHQAESIAHQRPGQIWFPWNPLVTYYAERRFDHVEDGLYVRFVSARPLSYPETRAHLPPNWSAMAMLTGSSDWGLASHFCPTDAAVSHVGFWTLTTWQGAKSPSK
jgi:hypothetical protein